MVKYYLFQLMTQFRLKLYWQWTWLLKTIQLFYCFVSIDNTNKVHSLSQSTMFLNSKYNWNLNNPHYFNNNLFRYTQFLYSLSFLDLFINFVSQGGCSSLSQVANMPASMATRSLSLSLPIWAFGGSVPCYLGSALKCSHLYSVQ